MFKHYVIDFLAQCHSVFTSVTTEPTAERLSLLHKNYFSKSVQGIGKNGLTQSQFIKLLPELTLVVWGFLTSSSTKFQQNARSYIKAELVFSLCLD